MGVYTTNYKNTPVQMATSDLYLDKFDFIKPSEGVKDLTDDLWRAIRQLSHEDKSMIVIILYKKGPLTFGELAQETEFPMNKLNHALIDLRKLDLITLIEKEYYLTTYCVAVLNSFKLLRDYLAEYEDIAKPAKR